MRPGEPIFTYRNQGGMELNVTKLYNDAKKRSMGVKLVKVTIDGESQFRNRLGESVDLAKFINDYNISSGRTVQGPDFEAMMIEWMQTPD